VLRHSSGWLMHVLPSEDVVIANELAQESTVLVPNGSLPGHPPLVVAVGIEQATAVEKSPIGSVPLEDGPLLVGWYAVIDFVS
jgi:hypothetical protein